jgi:2-phospho-L-lactate guanylyltransferase
MKPDPAMLWTIVPVRGVAAGKSRLAPVLNQAERAALNRALLVGTLAAVREWSGAPQRTIVVSPCASALALAREAGATIVREGAHAIGLNRAVKLGVAQAAALGATYVLILPADLVQLSVDALTALLKAAADGGIVLAPDKAGTGTNAILVDAGAGFEFAFGPASLMAHRAAAGRAGFAVSLVQCADLELDLDTPDDLARWRSRAGSVTPASREAV